MDRLTLRRRKNSAGWPLDRPLVSSSSLCIRGAAISAIRDGPRVLSVRTEDLSAGAMLMAGHCEAVHGPTESQYHLIATYPAQDENCCGVSGGFANPLHIHKTSTHEKRPGRDELGSH